MNDIKVFTHPDFGSMEIWIGPDGKPWFPATESAEILKYSNPQKAIRDHCLEEGCTIRSAPTAGGIQQKKYINRPNLSRLIARSHLPEATRFESWIFDDVLESVFDRGGYLTPQKVEEVLLNPDTIIRLATDLKAEREEKQRLALKVEQDAPKVMFAEAVSASDDSILIGELAKYMTQKGVKTGPNRLFESLRKDGYLCCAKGERWNTPTQRAMEMGLFEIKKNMIMTPDGPKEVRPTTKVTGKGQIYFINHYRAKDQPA